MRQWVLLSGKGGTGKTSLSAALAELAAAEEDLVLVDADADAANLALLLDAGDSERHDFRGARLAVIDAERCQGCLECVDACRFDALAPGHPPVVAAVACEGCGACFFACPVGGIRMEELTAGHWMCAASIAGPLLHARLAAGCENSGKLVSELRRQAADLARRRGAGLVIIDGPPGIGCPLHAAVTGADLAVLVTEPSLAALHDLERALDTVAGFGVPAVALLNKVDLSPPLAERVRAFCRRRGLPLLGEIPFMESIQEALERGEPMTRVDDAGLRRRLRGIWEALRAADAAPARSLEQQ